MIIPWEYKPYYEFHIKDLNLLEGLDVYEFGVYGGGSLSFLARELQREQIKVNRIWGIDNFIGLPSSEAIWKKGDYNAQNLFNSEEAAEWIQFILKTYVDDRITIIKSQFNELSEYTVAIRRMKPASYVNIDCDLYYSCKDVLEFLHNNKLMIKGTIIKYDDWNEDFGEAIAHKEICKKYNLKFKRLKSSIFKLL